MERCWAPGRRLGRQLLQEWWDVAVPLLHAVMDVGLGVPAGMEMYKVESSSSSKEADRQATVGNLALHMSLCMTPLDQVPNGEPPEGF